MNTDGIQSGCTSLVEQGAVPTGPSPRVVSSGATRCGAVFG
jgi:hypothetical protein